MRGIIIEPDDGATIVRLPDTQEGLQRLLGGNVQCRPFGRYFAALLYSDHAGQAMPSRHYLGQWYYGRLVIVGWRNNRLTALDKDTADELVGKWSGTEVQA